VVRQDGVVLAGTECATVRKLLPSVGRKVRSFGLSGSEDWYASDATFAAEGTRFRLHFRGRNLGVFESQLYGAHNLRNVLASLAACQEVGVDVEALRQALPRFSGVRRRQEVVLDERGWTIVDDFAHHPTAIRETLKALKQRYPGRRLVACYEPRSFTCQTKLHEVAYRQAFHLAEVVLLSEVRPSSKIPEAERLDLENVRSNLEGLDKHAEILAAPDGYLDWFSRNLRPGDLVAFFSSGNFHDLPARLATLLEKRPGL
jgi:UDP-N-acetylmuramate: L-alanyl-gamma-D-glutamyl-meso-diaminopimelate ligase